MLAMLGNAIEFLEVLQFGILAVPQFAQARRAKNFTSEVIGMLVRYLLLAGLLLPAAAVVSSAQTDSVPMKVRHIHIRVTDVERTKAFYRDKLGFKVVNERPGQMVEFEGGQLWFGKWEGPGPLPTQAI
ncbi:MAG: VOC family protein, partial [Acidobacteria bacterium]|nr:VOC family protein [Acidobacteriota bacterium]